MIIGIGIDISGVMSYIFRTQFLALKPSAIPSMVPFKIYDSIPGTIPKSIAGAMLDVFWAQFLALSLVLC